MYIDLQDIREFHAEPLTVNVYCIWDEIAHVSRSLTWEHGVFERLLRRLGDGDAEEVVHAAAHLFQVLGLKAQRVLFARVRQSAPIVAEICRIDELENKH